tara:strand:- start:2570 stop:2995 length:426 start_codon:yes stop_codon:yes gene_type:complete
MIEKRIRKDLRINKKIGEKINLLHDDSKEFRIARLFLKNIFGSYKKIIEVKKANKKTLIATNLDREIKKHLESYLKNETFRKNNNNNVLNNVLEEEIIKVCQIKKLSIGKKEIKNELIETIEKKYSGTKFALAKSFEKIIS